MKGRDIMKHQKEIHEKLSGNKLMENIINEKTLIKYIVDYGKNKGSFIQIDSFDDDTFSVINVCYDNKKRYFDNRIDYIKSGSFILYRLPNNEPYCNQTQCNTMRRVIDIMIFSICIVCFVVSIFADIKYDMGFKDD